MRCLKSSMIDNKHWNMYLLYILLHYISPSIYPLFTIRSWSISTLSYSIIPTSVGLFPGHRPVDAYCLSIIYGWYFSIESMALAGFNWLPLLPWQWFWQINSHLIVLSELICSHATSLFLEELHVCASLRNQTFMRAYRLDLLSYWINHACLFLVNAEVSVYIQSWSVWWCQL